MAAVATASSRQQQQQQQRRVMMINGGEQQQQQQQQQPLPAVAATTSKNNEAQQQQQQQRRSFSSSSASLPLPQQSSNLNLKKQDNADDDSAVIQTNMYPSNKPSHLQTTSSSSSSPAAAVVTERPTTSSTVGTRKQHSFAGDDAPTPTISNCIPKHDPPPIELDDGGTSSSSSSSRRTMATTISAGGTNITSYKQQQKQQQNQQHQPARFSSSHTEPILVTRRILRPSLDNMMMITTTNNSSISSSNTSSILRPKDVLQGINAMRVAGNRRRRRRRATTSSRPYFSSAANSLLMLLPYGDSDDDDDDETDDENDTSSTATTTTLVPIISSTRINDLPTSSYYHSNPLISTAISMFLPASVIVSKWLFNRFGDLLFRRCRQSSTEYDNTNNLRLPPSTTTTGDRKNQLQLQYSTTTETDQRHKDGEVASKFVAHRERTVGGGGTVKGIPNYGQTCFLNSILQALASLEPFVAFLEGIVQVRIDDEDVHYYHDDELYYADLDYEHAGRKEDEKDPDNKDQSLCLSLLQILHSANGYDSQDNERTGWGRRNRIDTRDLLRKVGTKHSQFRAKFAAGVGREQQDAEELLQALVGVVVSEAGLDTTTCYSTTTAVNNAYHHNNPLSGAGTCGVYNDDDDDDDEILTAVSGARERHQHSEEAKKKRKEEDAVVSTTVSLSNNNDLKVQATAMGNGVYHPDCSAAASTPTPPKDDEKKQDEVPVAAEPPSLFCCEESIDTPTGEHKMKDERNLSAAMRMMLTSTSSITPSPLCGWIGSALQCRACKHVRPIQNSPFLDIPVVPTAVSSYLASSARGHVGVGPHKPPTGAGPPCTLEHCLEEFTSVERVQDVECRSCTLTHEISVLDEEAQLLRGAVEAVRMKARRNKQKQNQEQAVGDEADDPGKHLREELEAIESKLTSLRAISPDEENAMERILATERPLGAEEDITNEDGSPSSAVKILRNQAFKCLLLTRLPSVLAIHIQRRFYDPHANRMLKTSQHVQFPEYLDVGPFCAYGTPASGAWAGSMPSSSQRRNANSSKCTYKLVSAVEHCGGAFYGHYVSYRRDPVSGGWLYISDDTVKPVDWTIVRNCQAYMLFYEAL